MTEYKIQSWLERPQKLQSELYVLIERREKLKSVKMTASYNKVRVKRVLSDDTYLAELSDLEKEIENKRRAIAAAELEIDHCLRCVVRSAKKFDIRIAIRDTELLRLRYLYGLSWTDISTALAKRGFHPSSRRTLFNWHRQALRRLSR